MQAIEDTSGKHVIAKDMTYFDYIMQLDRAIESVCQEFGEQGKLEIGGVDFTEAYKRMLYFRYRDSNLLFAQFAKTATPKNKWRVALDIDRRLALRLGAKPGAIQLCKQERLRDVVRNVKFFAAKRAFLPDKVRADKRQVEFLLVLSGVKFFTVLAPLLDRLGAGAAFVGKDVEKFATPQRRMINLPTRWRLASLRAWSFDQSGYRSLSSLCANLYYVVASCRPQCLIVAEGNSAQDAITGIIGKAIGIPVICIQHGWSPFMHVGFKNMPYDKFCVWGDRFREVLEKENNSRIFATTGSHQLNGLRQLNGEQRVSHARNSVGVLLQNPPRKDGRFGLIDEQAWNRSLAMIRDAIQRLPGIEFRIRPHPAAEEVSLDALGLGGLSNVTYSRPRLEVIAQFFETVDISISVYSTTLYESIHAGVWPIILDVVGFPGFTPNLVSKGLADLASSSEELIDQIERFYHAPGVRKWKLLALKDAANEYFSATGDAALDNIVNCIRGEVVQ